MGDTRHTMILSIKWEFPDSICILIEAVTKVTRVGHCWPGGEDLFNGAQFFAAFSFSESGAAGALEFRKGPQEAEPGRNPWDVTAIIWSREQTRESM